MNTQIILTSEQIQEMSNLLYEARIALADSANLAEFMPPDCEFGDNCVAFKFQMAAMQLLRSNCAAYDKIVKFHERLEEAKAVCRHEVPTENKCNDCIEDNAL